MKDLRVVAADGTVVVDDVAFDVRPGEVLAVAGVQGNGQTELVEAIVGLAERVTGSIVLDGEELLGKSVRGILDDGVGFVPEDRTEDGLVGGFTVAENLILDRSSDPEFVRGGTIRRAVLDDVRQGAHRRVRHPHAGVAACPPARCPAATSRRS